MLEANKLIVRTNVSMEALSAINLSVVNMAFDQVNLLHGSESLAAVQSAIIGTIAQFNPLYISSDQDVTEIWETIDGASTDQIPVAKTLLHATQLLFLYFPIGKDEELSEHPLISMLAGGLGVMGFAKNPALKSDQLETVPKPAFLAEAMTNNPWLVVLMALSLFSPVFASPLQEKKDGGGDQ